MNKYWSEENQIFYRKFAENFANTVISKDFNQATEYFATWLKTEVSADDFRKKIESELREMNEVWEIEQLIYPEEFEVSFNPCSLSDLNKEAEFPKEIAKENFRQWMVIQFLPDEEDERIEFDAWFDFWFAVVELNGELKIGHFEFSDPD